MRGFKGSSTINYLELMTIYLNPAYKARVFVRFVQIVLSPFQFVFVHTCSSNKETFYSRISSCLLDFNSSFCIPNPRHGHIVVLNRIILIINLPMDSSCNYLSWNLVWRRLSSLNLLLQSDNVWFMIKTLFC